jgi:cobyrinic acid a,c-diamide synthase
MAIQPPRVVLAGLRGGSGKTLLAVGLSSFWTEKGLTVRTFKKGPDFIDAGWLGFASGRACYNLDPFLMSDTQIIDSFLSHSAGTDISVIEGNHGLYDGLEPNGDTSTATLARLLKTPVILIVDVTMATRTMAALVMGCQRFDPDLNIVAVVLNRVAGHRQESVVKHAIEHYCGIPVIGSVPKLKVNFLPERHMGLVPYQERDDAKRAIAWAREIAEKNLDLKSAYRLAHEVVPLETSHTPHEAREAIIAHGYHPRIGFIRDSSIWFYYPENLDQLKYLEAELVEINSIHDAELPDLDALYIGGGFPETQAQALADNKGFRASLKKQIESGLPVYAECGGLIYLGEALIADEATYPMVGALPLKMVLERKPQGHGYTVLEVTTQNPYYPVGEVLKGHEFHYTRAVQCGSEPINTVFKMRRGKGLDGITDGLCKKNLLATFTHIHAGGNPLWGLRLVKAALQFRDWQKRNTAHES